MHSHSVRRDPLPRHEILIRDRGQGRFVQAQDSQLPEDKKRKNSCLSSKRKSDKVVSEAPGGLLMYIYYRRDKSAGFAQINDFDQYEYKPITEMIPLNAGQVKALV